MRLSQPSSLLTLLFTTLSTTHTSNARPNPVDNTLNELLESRYHYLSERSCAHPCGWAGQICCSSGETCDTNSAGQAVCNGGGTGVNAQAAAGWELYTTTYVETDFVTRTSTYSRLFGAESTPAAPPPISQASCQTELGESPCGHECCATGLYCAYAGKCLPSIGHEVESSSAYIGQIPTATNTAPLRPTSNVATTVTSTGSATTTVPFQSASASASAGAAVSATSNNGLSGGAIAGIVIGVIIGVIILLILLAVCCFSAGLSGIASFFGLGRRRRRQETYIEEHRHRHSSHGAGGGGGGRRWFGVAPARVDRPKRKTGGVGGLTAVVGGLTALAVFLGLKRRRDRKEKSEYGSGSSYYSDYITSASESMA